MAKRKSRRKYEQGDRITSLDEMIQQEFVMIHNKVYHRGWVSSWRISLARIYLQRGCYKAIPIATESVVQT